MRAPRRSGAALLCLALLAGCSRGDGDGGRPWPSGSLGPVTQGAADGAAAALCSMLAGAPERARLNAIFEDRAHEELHVIAAAAQPRSAASAGALLVAMERVEADLARAELPPSIRTDARTLLRRTQDALLAIGLQARACEADAGYRPGSA
jgi:hypothetical protein